MKKGDKKKQQKAFRKRSQARQERKKTHVAALPAPAHRVRQARELPIEGCWVNKGWEEDGLAVVTVVRRQPDGNYTFGNYLVDTLLLGVKDAMYAVDVAPARFRHDLLPGIYRMAGAPTSISVELAHEIVYGGLEYAERYGFRPHSDFKVGQYVLDPPEAHPRSGKVKFGKDGKPFFVAGPHDKVPAILRQLERTAGQGNFHYMAPVEMFAEGDEDEFELVEDEDDEPDGSADEPGQQGGKELPNKPDWLSRLFGKR